MTTQNVCLRCKGALEEGFTFDWTRNGLAQQTWMEGPPQPSFWFGIKSSGTKYKVATWRCTECGYLESRATERTDD